MKSSSVPTPIPLTDRTLPGLDPARVSPPRYDRSQVATGIVHLGPGAFHRAHQADYIDRLLAADPRWGICAVSLRSRSAPDALTAQDGLYTLVILDEEIGYRIIGSLKSVVHASDPRSIAALEAPGTRLVTLTITEKGYCLGPEGALDLSHPDIRSDLASPRAPQSAIGWLVEGLRRRRALGLPAPDIVSCDNLSRNGEKLRAAVISLAREIDVELARWIEGEAQFPSTMIDSITPATDEALRSAVRDAAGVDDAWPVQREAFTSWIIEDIGSPSFPDLRSVGAVMTSDVAAHERAKLRMLNGAHSTLAYFGLAKGFTTVGEAMGDRKTAAFIDDLMRVEVAPGLEAPRGLDLDAYRAALLKRFRNPAIAHKLSQIAWDGSQKLPIRLLETIADNLAAGRPVDRLSLGVAAWMRFVVRAARQRCDIVDPLKSTLLEIGAACRDDPATDTALFWKTQVFPAALVGDARFRQSIRDAYAGVTRAEVHIKP